MRTASFPADVYFVSTCNEERGASGARGLMAEGFRTDAALVAEPTDLEIVDAHKGVVRWRIRTHGVAAHSSAPERGVNAISAMARLIERINGPLAGALAKKRHPRLGSPTVCVGTIRGGTQVNVVPAQCEIEVDRRLLPDETSEQAAADLVRELEDLKGSAAGFEYSLEEIERYPPLEEDPKGPIASAVAAACAKVLGRATFAAAPWGANSGVFKSAGIPCVLFGPGSIRQAHTRDEFVELEQVAQAVGVYAEVIRSFGRFERRLTSRRARSNALSRRSELSHDVDRAQRHGRLGDERVQKAQDRQRHGQRVVADGPEEVLPDLPERRTARAAPRPRLRRGRRGPARCRPTRWRCRCRNPSRCPRPPSPARRRR